MQRLYASAITAQNLARFMVTTTVVMCFATSENEALGKAIRYARERYLASDGYSNHSAETIQVPDDVVVAAYKELTSHD